MSIILHDGGRVPDPTRPTITPNPPEKTGPKEDIRVFIVIAVFFLVSAVFFASQGAPAISITFAAVGVGFILIYGWAKELELDDHYRKLVKEDEARQRFNDEVNLALRTTLRGTVKVRCKYCEMLNDEDSEECESCGAPL